MRIDRRQPRWNDFYTIAGLYIFPGLVLAAYISISLPPTVFTPCWLKHVTGIPCPTCGAWRSLYTFFHGSFANAWRLQPLVISTGLVLAAIFFYALLTAIARKQRLFLIFSRKERYLTWFIALALFLVNWVFLIFDGR